MLGRRGNTLRKIEITASIAHDSYHFATGCLRRRRRDQPVEKKKLISKHKSADLIAATQERSGWTSEATRMRLTFPNPPVHLHQQVVASHNFRPSPSAVQCQFGASGSGQSSRWSSTSLALSASEFNFFFAIFLPLTSLRMDVWRLCFSGRTLCRVVAAKPVCNTVSQYHQFMRFWCFSFHLKGAVSAIRVFLLPHFAWHTHCWHWPVDQGGREWWSGCTANGFLMKLFEVLGANEHRTSVIWHWSQVSR